MCILCGGVSSVARSGDRGSLAGGGTIRGPATGAGVSVALCDRDARACRSSLRGEAVGSQVWGQCLLLRIGPRGLPFPCSAGGGGTGAWASAPTHLAYAWPPPRIALAPYRQPCPQPGAVHGTDGRFAAGGGRWTARLRGRRPGRPVRESAALAGAARLGGRLPRPL